MSLLLKTFASYAIRLTTLFGAFTVLAFMAKALLSGLSAALSPDFLLPVLSGGGRIWGVCLLLLALVVALSAWLQRLTGGEPPNRS